jgi:hypothetical protein
MSDTPPTQSMFVPNSPSNPELRYDGAGNAYAHDHAGNWLSHPGIAQAVTRTQCPQGHVSYKVGQFIVL